MPNPNGGADAKEDQDPGMDDLDAEVDVLVEENDDFEDEEDLYDGNDEELDDEAADEDDEEELSSHRHRSAVAPQKGGTLLRKDSPKLELDVGGEDPALGGES